MKRELVPFTTVEAWLLERSKDVTSTEVSALFGVSPWLTEFELWHRKAAKLVPESMANERVKWGSRLEAAIATGIAEDRKVAVSPYKNYIRLPESRIGSSFDYLIESEDAILEIKNVDALQHRDKWVVVGSETVEAPPHIEMQVQHQMLVSGKPLAYIGALVGGNTVVLLKREADKEIHDLILNKVKNFWDSVDRGTEPKPDFKQDAQFIKKLYNDAKKGTEKVDDSNELKALAERYNEITKQAYELNAEKWAIQSEILMRMKDVEMLRGNGFKVTAGVVKGTEISYSRPDYRNFRISFDKQGEKKI